MSRLPGGVAAGRHASRYLPREVESVLHGLIHLEQYMDFLRNRMFRQTLICHDR
jgi:methyltransferase-like protein